MKSYRRTLLSGAGHVKGRPMAFCFGDKKDKNDNLDNEGGRSNGVKHTDDAVELLQLATDSSAPSMYLPAYQWDD